MTTPDTTHRLPTYFVSHGGGPWPWIKELMGGDWTKLEDSLTGITHDFIVDPRAILVVSGHWEEPAFTVQTNPSPPMLYDYGGFPEFTYHLQYPAPGSPAVAERVVELLADADIPVGRNGVRGFDHGTFVPLHVMYPDAHVPVLQLSIRHGYDPQEHLAVGRALAPLRDEGIVILGSGFTYHNLRAFGPAAAEPSRSFEQWLTRTITETIGEERSRLLTEWSAAPGALASHPAADHLIPLMVAVGAAEDDRGERIYYESEFMGSITSASYRFGVAPMSTVPTADHAQAMQ